MFALVKCGQVRCHLLFCPCQILPHDSISLPLSILLVEALCSIFFQTTQLLLINHALLIKVYASMLQICGWTILFLSRNWQTTGINLVNKLVVFCILYGLRKGRDRSLPIWSLEYILWSLTLRRPSYAAPQLPFLLYVPTASLQKWTILSRFRCKALSRHAKK